MPFRAILDHLISETEGALGAVFLDESGEIVHQVDAAHVEQDMRLVAAWVGIYIRQLERVMSSDGLGKVQILHTQNDRFHLFVRPLEDGYCLVLMQRAPSLSAQSRRALKVAGDSIVEQVLR